MVPLLLCAAFCTELFEITADQSMLHNISVNLLKSDMGFLKELIMNSIDANRRLAVVAGDESVVAGRDIVIEFSDSSLTIADGGIGMDKDDLKDTILKLGGSVSREHSDCVGKFGIGFYSSFVVADEVTVVTKKWRSDKAYKVIMKLGSKTGEVSEDTRSDFGTTVTLKLRNDFKSKITDDKIEEWISANLLDSGIHRHFNVYLKKKEEDAKEDGAAESKLVKVEFMPWTDSKDFADLKSIYEKVFKGKGELLHAEKVGFEIVQKEKTGAEVPAYFEVLLFLPEVFDMRLFGIENTGEFHMFVSGMKVQIPKLSEFLQPFCGIVTSSTALTTSTRESLLNKEDEDSMTGHIEKALARIISSLHKTDKRDKTISSYNSYVKSGALSKGKEKGSIGKRLFEIAAFETMNGTKTIGEMCDADGDELYYTDVSPKLVKMRKNVANPNFDNISAPFFFVSGFVDNQIVSIYKDTRKKTLKNLFSKEFKERETVENLEFEIWVKSFLGNFVSDVVVSKRLKDAPFALRLKDHALSSNIKQMIGENTVDSSPFKSIFVQLPVLEYNPCCDEVKALLVLRSSNESLARNILRSFLAAVSIVSITDVDDKVGAYISLKNVCNHLLGLPTVEDDAKKIGEKDKQENNATESGAEDDSEDIEENAQEPEKADVDAGVVDADAESRDEKSIAASTSERFEKDLLREEL